MIGSCIAGGVLLLVVALAVRSIWKDRKKGGCTGDCAGCSGCGCHR